MAPHAFAAPSPPAHPLFGHVPQMRRDALELFTRSSRELGDVVRLQIVQPMHLVTHPDLVKEVLQDRHQNFRKSLAYQRLRPLVGHGLLTSEGQLWRRQRALIQPAFNRARLGTFAAKMAARVDAMLEAWAAAGTTTTLDVHAEMMRITLAILGDTLFSADLSDDASKTGRAVRVVLTIINRRLQDLVPLPFFVPTASNVRFLLARAELERLVTKIIAERRRAPGEHDDLLSTLMAATDEHGGGHMNARQLRDEVMTLVLAGHETSAAALSWTAMLLATAPEHEERLHEEAVRVLAGRHPSMDDLPALAFTRRVLEESMRLYPPVWLIAREACVEEVLAGYRIPSGAAVFLSPWVTHRDPRFWERPEAFDPDRFLPERAQGRPKFAFFPFAGGPRICAGARFAMMEMQIVLAMIVRRFRFVAVEGPPAVLDPGLTLTPRGGLRVRVEVRS